MWPAVIGGIAALASTALGVREARENRKWQEQMSNTAHQREVLDMQRAGINPVMSARGAGASTPQGEVADYGELARSVGSAMAIKQTQAAIDLTRAQAEAASAAALKSRVEAADLQSQAESGRYEKIRTEADILELDFRQRQALFDTVVSQAAADLEYTQASSRGVKARAILDEMDQARAMNAQALEKWLAGGSPAARLFLDVVRGFTPLAGKALAKPAQIHKYILPRR